LRVTAAYYPCITANGGIPGPGRVQGMTDSHEQATGTFATREQHQTPIRNENKKESIIIPKCHIIPYYTWSPMDGRE
jgi:hypothetical protein